MLAKQALPFCILGYVARIAQKHLQLNVFVTRAFEQELIVMPIVRTDQLQLVLRDAMGPLPFGCLKAEQGAAQFVTVLSGRFCPVGFDRVPKFLQSLFIGIAVLNHEAGDAFGMLGEQSKADRRAVVHHV